MTGWIKLHRSLLDWEWYSDVNVTRVFLHLLLTANHKDKNYRGELVQKGQALIGYKQLSEATNLTIQQVRTALTKLEKTGEINKQTNSKGTKITIRNYSSYQEDQKQDNKQSNKPVTSEQQASNKQVTTNKNDKNVKNDKKKRKQLTSGEVFESLPIHFQTTEVSEALSNWIGYKKEEFNSGYFTNKSFIELTNKLTPELLVADIKHSIRNNWKGIYPDPEARKTKQQQSGRQTNHDRNMQILRSSAVQMLSEGTNG